MAQRLVVELNSKSYADLAWLSEHKELNKTTVTNQALQVLRLLTEAEEQGGKIFIEVEASRSILRLL